MRLLTEARDAQVRGGIERYLRTFPQGGHWKGKNYLFDRRFEQQPEGKSDADLQKDVESWCAVCGEPWDLYRGQFRCPEPLCKVPVLVRAETRSHVGLLAAPSRHLPRRKKCTPPRVKSHWSRRELSLPPFPTHTHVRRRRRR